MSSLQVFTYQESRIRTVLRDGELWFVAKDVCDVLEVGNPSDALTRLDADERALDSIEGISGRMTPANIVNESGLYSLILGSRKPEARAFKRWVTHEVLPSIRRTGSYSFNQPRSIEDLIILQAQSMKEIRAQADEALRLAEVANHRIDSLDNVNVIGDKQQRLVSMVKKYAAQNGVTWERAWRDFTDSFNKAYNTNLKLRMENYKTRHGLSSLTRPQYLSVVEQLDDALRVADKMLNLVGV